MTTFGERHAEQLARLFHETYERLAPEYGYETRPETAIPWEQIPDDNRNKRLMIAVAGEVLHHIQLDEMRALIRDHEQYLQEIAPFSYRDGQKARLLRERTHTVLKGK